MLTLARRFLLNNRGATAIEYALIAGLVAVAIITSINAVTVRLKVVFNEVASALK
jgi:pilus assembly protein Flp/PilA